jgi:ankyrin repeat protein
MNVDVLIEMVNRPDIRSRSETPLHLAVKYGYIDFVKYLVINNKVDIEAKNNM